MKTINLIIGFLAIVILLVLIPGVSVGLLSGWAFVSCLAGFFLLIIAARVYRKRKNSGEGKKA